MYDLEEPQSTVVTPQGSPKGFSQLEDKKEEGKTDMKHGNDNHDGLKIPPFEFVALEACLEAACSCLESEVSFLPL